MAFLSPKIVFALANCVDPYERMHYVAFHNGLPCLSKYTFWSHQYKRIKPKYGDMDNFFIYDKYSEISNTFLFLFSNQMLVIRAGIHKMLVRIANREDPDQTASSEAV